MSGISLNAEIQPLGYEPNPGRYVGLELLMRGG